MTLDGDLLRLEHSDGREAEIVITTGPADQAPWVGVPDVFLECSGERTARERSEPFLVRNTKVVIISATSYDADATLLAGFNDSDFNPEKDKIVSFGSCTVNGFVPLAAFLNDTFGIKASAVNVVHNIQRHRLAGFNTLQRKFCTLEKMGSVFLPFLTEDNFIVTYTVVPYDGASMLDFTFRFNSPVSRDDLLKALKSATSVEGKLSGLYGLIPKDTGPAAHILSPYSAVIVEEGVHVKGDTAYLFSYFYNEGTARYHGLVNRIVTRLT